MVSLPACVQAASAEIKMQSSMSMASKRFLCKLVVSRAEISLHNARIQARKIYRYYYLNTVFSIGNHLPQYRVNGIAKSPRTKYNMYHTTSSKGESWQRKKNARAPKRAVDKRNFPIHYSCGTIIAFLVILTTDNSLKTRINDFLVNIGKDTHTDPRRPVPVTGDGKVYTSIHSGKGNITLPGYIDTQIPLWKFTLSTSGRAMRYN
jgi:hypothetical protein